MKFREWLKRTFPGTPTIDTAKPGEYVQAVTVRDALTGKLVKLTPGRFGSFQLIEPPRLRG